MGIKNNNVKDTKRTSAFLGLSLILLVALGCGLAPMVKQMKDKAEQPTVLRSSDGKYQLTIPGGWKEAKNLHEEASIQASRAFEELYVIVISESKKDFANNTTLADYTKILRSNVSENIEASRMTDTIQVVVSGNKAMRYEMHGVVDKIRVAYINTTVETRNAFHQVFAWTLESKFETNKTKLLEVVDTFKEAMPDTSAPPPPAKK